MSPRIVGILLRITNARIECKGREWCDTIASAKGLYKSGDLRSPPTKLMAISNTDDSDVVLLKVRGWVWRAV